MALGRLALVKPLYLWIKSDGKLCRFHIGPLKIRVAIFGVPLTFTFTIADLRTPDTTAVGGVVTNRRKTANRTGFKDNRLGQYLPDASDAQQLLVSRRVFEMLTDGLFQGFDLLAQAFQEPQGLSDLTCESA